MGNYLDNLISRQLGKASVVRPRPASLFEPTPLLNSLNPVPNKAFVPFELDRFAGGRSGDGIAGAVQSDGSGLASDVNGPTKQPTSDEDMKTVWRGRQHILPATSVDVDPIEPANVVISDPMQPDVLKGQEVIAKAGTERSAIKDARGPFSDEVAAAPPQYVGRHSLEPASTMIAPVLGRGEKRDQQMSLRVRKSGAEGSSSDSIGKGIVAYPRIASRVESRNKVNDFASPSYQSEPKPEPTINVTIGRVEVRAMLPATSQRKQSPNTPMMGLDEYLRNRAKGDGR
jgi:hypothetical protein